MPGGPAGPPDKPGEYRVIPVPQTAEAIKATAEAQESHEFYLVAMNLYFMVFYKTEKKH